MAIIITNDGDKIVGTIADRNAIIRKFDGMKVRVSDSIADVLTGGGEAEYEWSVAKNKWMLVWKENKDDLTFVTEIKQISGGQVIADHVPQSSLVWDCTIQTTAQDGSAIIMYDVRPDVLGDVIDLGTTSHDGQYLVFTYGYGVIQAAVTAILSANANGGSTVSTADLALKANSADVYTKTETDSAIQAIVGAAPATLDTLKEIADQLASDESAVGALTTAVSLKAPIDSPTFTGTVSGITKSMVGLGDVDNTADSAKPVSTATQTALDAKAPIDSPTFTGTVSGITKAMVGLGSVDNTADSAKPVSTATQTALDLKAPLTSAALVTPTVTGIKEVKVAMAANAINLATGNFFTKTITALTTFTVSNVPAAGTANSFVLDLTNGGAFTITWWSGVKWAAGTAPSLTASGRDLLAFFTHDGGTTWNGLVLSKDMK